jgi:Tn3 transposase DDE domain
VHLSFLTVRDKGVIRRKQEEAQTNQAMCLNLVTNAVVVWNTVYMQANWLWVLGTAELPHIDQGIRQQFHAKVSLLHVFKPQKQPLELILPRKGPINTGSQYMDGGIEQTLSSSLRVLSIARILFDVGDHSGIENALAIVRGIKAGVEIQVGSCQCQTNRFGHPLQGL